MKVVIGTFGTRGDVQPMVALGRELLRRRHDVTLVVPPNPSAWVTGFGLKAMGAGIDYTQMSQEVADGKLRPSLLKRVRGEVAAQLEIKEPLVRNADVVLGSGIFTAGAILSEQFGIPYLFIALCPQLIPSSEHPMVGLPWQKLPRLLNRWTWQLHHTVWNLALKETINLARRKRRLRSVETVMRSLLGMRLMLSCDERLGPSPNDAVEQVLHVGPWFFEEQKPLSKETEAFLQAGPPPVYIGFGSMADPEPFATTRRLFQSVRSSGARAIVSRGWAGLASDELPKDILLIDQEPHLLLFPRCSAIVHHGGAGTLHAAARAGVPQVVLPQLMDQL